MKYAEVYYLKASELVKRVTSLCPLDMPAVEAVLATVTKSRAYARATALEAHLYVLLDFSAMHYTGSFHMVGLSARARKS